MNGIARDQIGVGAATDRGRSEHFVRFYESEDFIANSVADYFIKGLKSGCSCIFIAKREQIDKVERIIAKRSTRLEDARRSGGYIVLDAADTLSKFMIDGMPDPRRFSEVTDPFVKKAVERGNGVCIFGEMVAVLWGEKNYAGAVRLEELWNELGQQYPFSLFCAYPMAGFINGSSSQISDQICNGHTQPTSTMSADERLSAVVLLHFAAHDRDHESTVYATA